MNSINYCGHNKYSTQIKYEIKQNECEIIMINEENKK